MVVTADQTGYDHSVRETQDIVSFLQLVRDGAGPANPANDVALHIDCSVSDIAILVVQRGQQLYVSEQYGRG